MIEIKHLSKTFQMKDGAVNALKDIDLTIPDGSIYGIIGMSGAGKSTLVRCINLLERPTEGSVGIAGSQTGVYPIDSPGGWQLIGRTPVRMYDPDRAVPILPKAGQYIKFYAIDQAEFDRIAALEASSGYTVHTYPRKEAEQA